MSVHLLVIGELGYPDLTIDEVVKRVIPSPRCHVLRVATPSDFLPAVVDAAGGEKIATLDVFDHGHQGSQNMGHGVLFDSTTVGYRYAEPLAELLADEARVRLLGCNTALGAAGRKLLLDMAAILGKRRVVYGTNCFVQFTEFGPDGFLVQQEAPCLFSSLSAVDGEAPTWKEQNP